MSFLVLKTKNSTHLEPPAFVPEGTYSADANGTFNVTNYEFVRVLVENKKIKQVEFSDGVFWILNNAGELWGCGGNSYGQQGAGSTTDVSLFTKRMTNVEQIVCSSNTTWVIKKDGTLWGCGRNDYGQQGSGNTTNVTTFTQRLTNVKKVFCSYATTFAIKNDDSLWGCGWASYGQQGDNNTASHNVTSFTKRMDNVEKVCCLDNITWVLTKDGKAMGCGYDVNGNVDGKSGSNRKVGTFTQNLDNVKDIYFTDYGDKFAKALTNDNKFYKLGVVTLLTSNVDRFIVKKGLAGASWDSYWVIKKDGTLWGMGKDSYGQQGSGVTTSDTNRTVSNFTQRLTNVKDVAHSNLTTYALKNDGTLWACGSNSSGQQSIGNTSTKLVGTFTQRLTNVKKVGCSSTGVWVLKNDGTLWVCGGNSYGQLGTGNTSTVTTFKQVTTNVEDFEYQVENFQALFVFKKNEYNGVYTCGRNHLGYLGTGNTTETVSSFAKRNLP